MPFRINPFTRKLDLVDINSIPPGVVDSISGNTGGPVGPDGSNDISFTASGGFTVTGNPGSFSLDMSPSGWTKGSVVFADSPTVFDEDNANFYYDSTAHSLLLGTTTTVSSSILSLVSTNRGFLPPSMTTAQKNAIGGPVAGLVVYDNTLNDLQYYNGSSWVSGGGVTSVTGTANQITASPTTGAVVVSLTDGISLGSYQAISPPTGGALIPGQVFIGTSSTNPLVKVRVSGGGTNSIGIRLEGTYSATDSAEQFGLDLVPALHPTGGAGLLSALMVEPQIVAQSGDTITTAAGIFVDADLGSNVGTISTYAQIYIDGSAHSGTITNRYGLLVQSASGGVSSNICAAFLGGITIGSSYSTTTPPSNGAIIEGTVSIGSSSAAASAILSAVSTTQGFLPPVMNNTQRDAIATPASGLVIYSTTDSDLEFWNGSTWIGFSGSGVTSVTGTTNQISASPTTGAVIVSLTDGISIGSYQATSPPTGGIIAPGRIGFGTSSPDSTFQMQVVSALGGGIRLTGTYASLDGTGNQDGIAIENTFSPAAGSGFSSAIAASPIFAIPSGQTTSITSVLYADPSYTGNQGSITRSIGVYYTGGGSLPAGSISLGYGGFFSRPNAGTTRVTLFSTDLTIGDAYNATAAPTDGVIIRGRVGVGTSNPSALAQMEIDMQSNLSQGLCIFGTSTTASAGLQVGYNLQPVFFPTGGTTTCIGHYNSIDYRAPSGSTIINAFGYYLDTVFSNNVGTIANVINFYVRAGSAGAGTISQAVGLTVEIPICSSNNICAYFNEGVAIGASFSGIKPFTNGAIIQGQVGIGSSSANSYQLRVRSFQANGMLIDGTLSGSGNQFGLFTAATHSHTGSGGYVFGVSAGAVVANTTGNSIDQGGGIYTSPEFTGNDGTITNAYGFYFDGGGATVGTITNGYGGRFDNPNFGTTKCALYTANLSIGYSATTPPSSGAIIDGQVSIGNSAPSTSWFFSVTADGETWAAGIATFGTMTAKNFNRQWGILSNPTMNPTGGASDRVVGIESTPVIAAQNATTIAAGVGIYTNVNWGANAGTITNAFSIRCGSGTSGTGTITTAWGLYVETPLCGATNHNSYFQNAPVMGENATGGVSCSLGSNAPNAIGTTTPNTWLAFKNASGQVCYVPCWR